MIQRPGSHSLHTRNLGDLATTIMKRWPTGSQSASPIILCQANNRSWYQLARLGPLSLLSGALVGEISGCLVMQALIVRLFWSGNGSRIYHLRCSQFSFLRRLRKSMRTLNLTQQLQPPSLKLVTSSSTASGTSVQQKCVYRKDTCDLIFTIWNLTVLIDLPLGAILQMGLKMLLIL